MEATIKNVTYGPVASSCIYCCVGLRLSMELMTRTFSKRSNLNLLISEVYLFKFRLRLEKEKQTGKIVNHQNAEQESRVAVKCRRGSQQ